MDADDQLGIDVPGIQFQHLFVVTARLQSDVKCGNKAPFDQADVHRMETPRPASREERVDIFGTLGKLLVRDRLQRLLPLKTIR